MTNPVINAAHVTGLPKEVFYVADPFIVKNGSTFYMFYEVAYDDGDAVICYSTSPDGLAWTYGGLCLDASVEGVTHYSYPQVIKVDGTWYMIPDRTTTAVKLYRATAFPAAWEVYKALLSKTYQIRDTTLFQYGGYFWLLLYDSGSSVTRLFYKSTLYDDTHYVEHPLSPIFVLADDPRNTRPGGRPIVRDGAVDILMQDSVIRYGEKVRAYRLTDLTITTVTATELETSPLLESSSTGWNAWGMHQLDRVDAGLSVVDGFASNSIWSIGIYRDVP